MSLQSQLTVLWLCCKCLLDLCWCSAPESHVLPPFGPTFTCWRVTPLTFSESLHSSNQLFIRTLCVWTGASTNLLFLNLVFAWLVRYWSKVKVLYHRVAKLNNVLRKTNLLKKTKEMTEGFLQTDNKPPKIGMINYFKHWVFLLEMQKNGTQRQQSFFVISSSSSSLYFFFTWIDNLDIAAIY